MNEEPYKLELLKITKLNGEIVYQVVDEKTADNIMNTSASYTYLDNAEIQFGVEYLGEVDVYVPEWMKKSIILDGKFEYDLET